MFKAVQAWWLLRSHEHLRGGQVKTSKGGVDPKATEWWATRGQQNVGQDDNNSRTKSSVEASGV